MHQLRIFVGTSVLGYAFWYLGGLLGLEFFGCLKLNGVGRVLGVWLGWKAARLPGG